MNTPSHSEKGFKYAIIAVVCFMLFLLFKVLAAREIISIDTYTYGGGFLMILVVIASLIGFFFSIRGLKDPNSMKKTIGIVVNAILIVLFVITTIVNAIDFSNSFS
ncbi:hypothetical protein [uncultured Psychroserpens sp.]|uniref:hypothetical protein n=1 Tax=uncultured Psychroserpens sp. TaxID=255436 RepID=UPI00260D9834|nr:hypothetical protein [uncultured Psychroserpens sp.]